MLGSAEEKKQASIEILKGYKTFGNFFYVFRKNLNAQMIIPGK